MQTLLNYDGMRQRAVEGRMCSICISDDVKSKAALNSCVHEFCLDCIVPWSKLSNTCPLCKIEFTQIFTLTSSGRKNKAFSVEKSNALYEEPEDSEDRIILNAEDFCYFCDRAEDHNYLLVCDHCHLKCCHIFCLDPPLEYIPEGEWFCDYCCENFPLQRTSPISNIFGHRNAEKSKRHMPERSIYRSDSNEEGQKENQANLQSDSIEKDEAEAIKPFEIKCSKDTCKDSKVRSASNKTLSNLKMPSIKSRIKKKSSKPTANTSNLNKNRKIHSSKEVTENQSIANNQTSLLNWIEEKDSYSRNIEKVSKETDIDKVQNEYSKTILAKNQNIKDIPLPRSLEDPKVLSLTLNFEHNEPLCDSLPVESKPRVFGILTDHPIQIFFLKNKINVENLQTLKGDESMKETKEPLNNGQIETEGEGHKEICNDYQQIAIQKEDHSFPLLDVIKESSHSELISSVSNPNETSQKNEHLLSGPTVISEVKFNAKADAHPDPSSTSHIKIGPDVVDILKDQKTIPTIEKNSDLKPTSKNHFKKLKDRQRFLFFESNLNPVGKHLCRNFDSLLAWALRRK
jgi:hypothetical protein